MVTLVDVLILAFAVATVAAIAFSGGEARHEPVRHLVCPGTGAECECTLVQDVRTGQYQDVVRCSALPDPRKITCDRACARQMNLGLPIALSSR